MPAYTKHYTLTAVLVGVLCICLGILAPFTGFPKIIGICFGGTGLVSFVSIFFTDIPAIEGPKKENIEEEENAEDNINEHL